MNLCQKYVAVVLARTRLSKELAVSRVGRTCPLWPPLLRMLGVSRVDTRERERRDLKYHEHAYIRLRRSEKNRFFAPFTLIWLAWIVNQK